MKNTIDWYENGLKNQKSHHQRQLKEIAQLQTRAYQSLEDIKLREFQLALAKKRGHTSFDDERFGLKRS